MKIEIENICNNSFEYLLWNKYSDLLNQNKKDVALFEVYYTLQNEMIHERCENCDNFLNFIKTKNLSVSLIVHVLNVLSVRKHFLSNWESFVQYGTSIIEKEYNQDETKQILKVIL